MVYAFSLLGSLLSASPAVADTPAEPTPSVATLDGQVVAEAWVAVTDPSPRTILQGVARRAEKAGGVKVQRSVDRSDGYVEMDVTWYIPEENWPELQEWLFANYDAEFETSEYEPDSSEGTGPRVISLLVEASTPSEPVAYLQIGPSAGVAFPAAGPGLGLAQPIGVRAMFFRDFSLDAAYAEPIGDEPWMLTLTMGTAACSELLGDCERRFLNPFIGAHVGYAWRGESWALLQGEIGMELVHLGDFIWEVNARPTVAIKRNEAALGMQATTAVLIPF